MSRLIDPRLHGSIPEHWPSICTILVITQTDSGSEMENTGSTTLTGHSGIPCRLGPINEVRPTDNADPVGDVRGNFNRRNLKLNRHCPAIVADSMLAKVDGVEYPIRGVEHDSQKFSTRLYLEIVRP